MFLTIILTIFAKESYTYCVYSQVYSFHQITCLRFNENICGLAIVYVSLPLKQFNMHLICSPQYSGNNRIQYNSATYYYQVPLLPGPKVHNIYNPILTF